MVFGKDLQEVGVAQEEKDFESFFQQPMWGRYLKLFYSSLKMY
jgi:hypothetical protein